MNAPAALDVTPHYSFNTIQFEQEILNVIVSSALVAIIVNSIATIISKVVQRTPRDSFSFNACRRFVIFLNSDDPLLLMTWWFGKYSFREKCWKRSKQRTRTKFLFVPLLARLVLFLAVVASIAVTLPTETELSGCENGDFRPTLNASQGRIRTAVSPPCLAIPMKSRLGTVTSTLKHCSSPNFQSAVQSQPVRLLLTGVNATLLLWHLSGNGTNVQYVNRLEWKQTADQTFFSLLSSSVTGEDIANTILEGLVKLGINCNTAPGGADGFFSLVLNDCEVIPFDVGEDLNSFLMSSIAMERVTEPQLREKVGTGTTLECPIDVLVNRPLVNIVPLAIFMVVIVVVHIGVSMGAARHGNIINSSHDVMRKVFDQDSRCNPIQDSPGVDNQDCALPLRRVLRDGKGHVGFLEYRGDQAVENFDEQTVVSQSRRTRRCKAGSTLSDGHPIGFQGTRKILDQHNEIVWQ